MTPETSAQPPESAPRPSRPTPPNRYEKMASMLNIIVALCLFAYGVGEFFWPVRSALQRSFLYNTTYRAFNRTSLTVEQQKVLDDYRKALGEAGGPVGTFGVGTFILGACVLAIEMRRRRAWPCAGESPLDSSH
jgi:hypothetical protein